MEVITGVVNAVKDDQIKSYWSHEVAKLLDISTSTLRKWSIALEAAGYPFLRDENDKRAYLERDIMPLQKMRELLAGGMGMENAANAVVLRFSELIEASRTMVVREPDDRSSPRYLELLNQNEEMRSTIHALGEQIERKHNELHEELSAQRQFIEESLKKRDEQLMQLLRQMQGERMKRSGKWWRLFKK